MDRSTLRRLLVVSAIALAFGLVALSSVPMCPLAAVAGVPCPGCGLTRATLALLHGEVRHALHLHPLVFVLAPLFAWGMGSAVLGYIRGPRPQRPAPWLLSPAFSALASLLLVLTLSVWAARFAGYLGGPAPVQTFATWSHTH